MFLDRRSTFSAMSAREMRVTQFLVYFDLEKKSVFAALSGFVTLHEVELCMSRTVPSRSAIRRFNVATSSGNAAGERPEFVGEPGT